MRWPIGWKNKTCIMGIINLTPDSFSDGGLYLKPEDALRQTSRLLNEGADVIDLGAQSTRPGANEVGIEEELIRLLPALRAIRSTYNDILISVDTYQSEVAQKDIDEGADWINEITGGMNDKNIVNVIARSNSPFVINHCRGDLKSMHLNNSYND